MAPVGPRVGDRVRLRGLAARPELNGRHGKVLRFVKDTGRWKVTLDGEPADSSLALKPDNLEALSAHGEGLARTVLLARERAGLAVADGSSLRLRTVHVLGATAWELGLQYAPLTEAAALQVGDRVSLTGLAARPELNGARGIAERFIAEKGRWKVSLEGAPQDGSSFVLKPENLQLLAEFRPAGFEGPWLQDGDRHVVRGSRVYGPDGDNVEEVEVKSPDSFTMTLDGETLTATLEPGGRQLTWSDGDTWVRPAEGADDAAVTVVLVGPGLPEEYPEGELRVFEHWPEPGVRVACFRGGYEAFVASADFSPAEVAVLANPGLCPSGVTTGFFDWAPALHALAAASAAEGGQEGEDRARGPQLCVCTGAEPYGEGEWLGDAVYDEQVLRGLGFEVLVPPARSAHACRVAEHPTCGWHFWAYTLVFRWPEGKRPGQRDGWAWAGYYKARRSRSELPRFRFRPPAPELRPAALDDAGKRSQDQGHGGEERKNNPEISDEEEKAYIAGMEWVGATVRTAWQQGGGASPTAAAAAAAVAAAEEFADRSRSRPLPPGSEHVVAVGACELAARVAASPSEGVCREAATAAAAVAVGVFEAIAQEALWGRRGSLEPEMVGHIVIGGLRCAEKANFELSAGVASSVGEHAAEAFELLGGPNRPPLGRLAEEMRKLVERSCESAGVAPGERKAIAEAVVDNLDLAIPAHGGREAALRISLKMHDAPPCYRVHEPS